MSVSENFEKRYPGLTSEKEIQSFWKENEIYKFNLKNKEKPIYSIDTPPPTVSGNLHIGHIFSFAQAEIIARFKKAIGYNVYFPIGFDDNGLASERLVEKELKIRAVDLPRDEFFKKCSKIVKKYEDEFRELLKSMGFSYDFDLFYTTISEKTRKISQVSFIELAKKKYAYLKESPVLWCTECRTSIAQAELDSKEVASCFHYISFEVNKKSLEIATTRPELLCGVVCIFVNPSDKRYKEFVGQKAKVPLYDFEVPIIEDKKVDIKKGTGAVMCATFGDTTDVDWYNEYNLEYKKVILEYGKIAKDVAYIGSLSVKKAREEIIRLLKQEDFLIKSENIIHNVSIHERCSKEIEIIPSKQWYVDVLNHKKKYLEALNQINWHPSTMKNRYKSWVENLKWDWCISRQRYFGIPFPVWYCKNCCKPHFAKEENLPIDPIKTNYSDICKACGCKEFKPEESVMDTWATSALTPIINAQNISVIEKEESQNESFKTIKDIEKLSTSSSNLIPMGMRTQAHDIIRTWAFYTIVKSVYHLDKMPWKDIMISGFVLAKKGEKISKSKGESNKFDPKKLIEEHTADALRYWAAGTKLGTDTFFDPIELKDTKRFLTKLWNSSKFVISHLEDFNLFDKPSELKPIDKWIINKTNKVINIVYNFLEKFEVGFARHTIDEFFWKDFCDNYIEIVKQRLYQPEIYGENERKSAQYASYYSFINILKMYSIYVPHISEYVYIKGNFKRFTNSLSIHTLLWEKNLNQEVFYDEKSLMLGENFKELISTIRKYKTKNNMSMKTPIDYIRVEGSKEFKKFCEQTEKDLMACTRAETVIY